MSMQGMGDPKEMGRGLLRQGEFDQASAVLREAVMMDPTDEEAWRLLGGALASKGDAIGAVEAFKQAVELVPQAGRSHYNLALAYQSAGRLPDAKASLERALTLDPDYEQARTRLAEVERQMGVSATPAAPVGLSSVGAAPGLGGLSSVGAAPGLGGLSGVGQAPAQDAGYTNIGGGNTSALSSLGGTPGTSYSTDTGHTNIGGGNTSTLGGLSGAPPPSAGPTLRTAPPPSYGGNTGNTGYAPPPSLGMSYGNDENNSGMKGEVPQDIKGGFNWGAFWFSWLWFMNHGQVGIGVGLLVVSLIPYLGGLVGLAGSIYAGVKGNELGWQNRRFQSVADFRACQAVWAKWALGCFIVSMVFGVIGAIIVIAAGGTQSMQGAR